MEITMRYVRGHVEVYTAAGQFLFSADTEAEAAAMLDRLYQVLGGKTDAVSEKAFADDAFTADSATYKQAMTAYYTAYQQYSSQASSASSKWTEYANGLYAKANISIYGLFA